MANGVRFPQAVADALPERFLIAYDGRWHVRETLCVTHDDEAYEARYDARPIASGDTLPEAVRRALAAHRREDPR